MFGLTGSFRVATPSNASQYRDRVVAKLTALLEQDEAGAITVSGSTIKYKRGYYMTRYTNTRNSRIGNFNPGELSVEAQNNAIIVRYCFGFEQMYAQYAFMAVALIILVVLSQGEPKLRWVVAFLLAFVFCASAYNLYSTRRWLKAGVVDVIAFKEAVELTN